MPTCPALCALRPRKPSNMLSCPAPPPPARDPASSKGSQTWLLRPQSSPTSSCSLPWLSSFGPPPLVSLLGCPRLPPPSTPLLQTPSSKLLPYPPLALETSLAVYNFLLATAALRRLLVALGELVMFIPFVDCWFDFRFCFGHIVKDACHFLYRRNKEHMI